MPREWQKKLTEKYCPQCKKKFMGHSNKKYCTDNCRRLYSYYLGVDPNAEKLPPLNKEDWLKRIGRETTCLHCLQKYFNVSGKSRYCSPTCRRSAEVTKNRNVRNEHRDDRKFYQAEYQKVDLYALGKKIAKKRG